MSSFPNDPLFVTALLNSRVSVEMLKAINPTMAFQVGDIKKIRAVEVRDKAALMQNARRCVEIATSDWNSLETSWEYSKMPLLENRPHCTCLVSPLTTLAMNSTGLLC